MTFPSKKLQAQFEAEHRVSRLEHFKEDLEIQMEVAVRAQMTMDSRPMLRHVETQCTLEYQEISTEIYVLDQKINAIDVLLKGHSLPSRP